MADKAWDVILNRKCIDTVFFDGDITKDEVLRSLIEHDGHDPRIKVERARWREGR